MNVKTSKDSSGRDVLLISCWKGQNKTIDHLIEKYGMSVWISRDNSGANALLHACSFGQNETIDHLVNHHKMEISEEYYQKAKQFGKAATIKHLQEKYGLGGFNKSSSLFVHSGKTAIDSSKVRELTGRICAKKI